MKREITLTVNGQPYHLAVDLQRTLLEVLRDELGLTGTKLGCGMGECGTCTVLVEGKPIRSCITLAVTADGKEVTTIEGLAKGDELHPIQSSFIKNGGFQCGYCTPGIIMAAKAILDHKPNPTEQEVRQAIAGHLCRCGSYPKIVKSVLDAAKTMREG